MLTFVYTFLFFYVGVVIVTSSPISTDTPSSVPATVPVCVNSGLHSIWGATNLEDGRLNQSPQQLNPYDCAYALLGFKLGLHNISKASFDFYSKAYISGVAPEGTWGLPTGTRSRQEGSGNCVAVVRMRHDFFASALPFPNGRYLDTISPKTQKDNWGVILAALDALQHDCIAGQKMGGWVAIGEGIIAAMWPSGSFMDKRYGVDTSEVDGVRSLQESYNYTSTELGG